MADTMPRQMMDTSGVPIHKDTTDERYRDLRRPRKVRFYVNGDRYFKGKKIFITPHRYFNFNDLLNDLTGKLPSNLNLPYGVRQIFTPRDGRRITDIEDLQDGEAYVCAGFEGFKVIKYGKAELEPWSMGVRGNRLARHPQSEENQDYGSEASYGSYRYRGYATNAFHPGRYFRTNGSFPHRKFPGAFGTANSSTYMQSDTVPIKPKVITIVRNGNKPRNNVKFLLHRRGVQSFEQLMADISEAFGPKFRNNKVKKLFTTRGREVQSISDFFRDDDVFIGVGNETLSDSDIRDIIEEIYPDSPYAKNLIKDWDKSRKKRDRALPPLSLKDQESDKRDSGFGDSTDSNNETDTISTGRQTFRDPKAGKRGKMGMEAMPGKEGYGALRAKARIAHDERDKARRRQQKMADAERRALDEERRRRGLIPLKPIEDPFKKVQEQKEREKEEARIRLAEERKQQEEEREKARKAAEEQERIEKEKKRQQQEEEEQQRKEQERLEKERKEQEHKEMLEKAEKAARERLQAAEKVEKENVEKDKDTSEKENQKAAAPKASRDRASRDAAREGRDERRDRKRSRQKIVRRSKAERQISGDEVILNKYELGRTLGDGNFAIVRMSRSRTTGAEYAMKVIDKPKLKGKEHMVENEIEIMKDCNHVNIVKLYEEYETPEKIFLVMELVKGGDLFDAITQSVKFGEVDSANMVKDLCNALFYLHSRHIVHRDLKPENLLVHRNKDGTITLKLADFGLAMEVKENIFTVCGTPTYVAPEILSEIGYGLEVDMWATGVITYILLCGFPPFRSPDRNQTELFEYIKAGEYEFLSPYWDNISNSAKDLIRRLLVVDKKKRYTAIDVLSHHWIVCNGDTITPRNTSKVEEVCRDLRKDLEQQSRQNLESYNKMKDRRRRDRDTVQQAA